MFRKNKPVLRGLRGPHAYALYAIERGMVVFGRDVHVDIQILDKCVSREHARLAVHEGGTWLEDLDSHNGTFVHGRAVERWLLQPGDRLRIGVAEYEYDEVRKRVLTSAVFLDKLTTRETLNATAVRQTHALRTSTTELPLADDQPDVVRESKRRTLQVSSPTACAHWQTVGVPSPVYNDDTPSLPYADGYHPPRDVPASVPSIAAPSRPRAHTEPHSLASPTGPLCSPSQSLGMHPSEADEGRPAVRVLHQTVDAVISFLELRDRHRTALKLGERERLHRLESLLREPTNRAQPSRRQWARLPCSMSAELGEQLAPATVTDIGGGGIRVETQSSSLAPQDEVTVRVALATGRPGRVAVFSTRVAWVDPKSGAFGAAFAGPARWEQAVACG